MQAFWNPLQFFQGYNVYQISEAEVYAVLKLTKEDGTQPGTNYINANMYAAAA